MAKRHQSKLIQANVSQVNVNKKGSCSLRAFAYLRLNEGVGGEPSHSRLRRADVSSFGPLFPLFLFSVFPASLRTLTLCCALHFPDASEGLRSEVRIYTVILYLLDEHICLLQGPHT